MNKQRVIFSVMICMAASLYSMEQDSKIQNHSIKRIINISDGCYSEVAFIDENHLVINGYKHNYAYTGFINSCNPQLIDICTGTATDFCKPKRGGIFKHLTASPDRCRIGIVEICRGDCDRLMVCDFVTGKKYDLTISAKTGMTDIFFQHNKLVIQSFLLYPVLVDYVNNQEGPATFLESLLIDNGYDRGYDRIAACLPKKQQMCFSEHNGDFLMYDFNTQLEKKLPYPIRHRLANILVSSDESFMLFRGGCCSDCHDKMDRGKDLEAVRMYPCSGWGIIDVETHDLIKLNNGGQICRSASIHPNNKCVVLMAETRQLLYCSAKTGELIAQQQYPEEINPKQIEYHSGQPSNVAFSPGGNLLAVLFPPKCVVFNVPFIVIHGEKVTKEKLVKVLLLLKNYEPILLPEDIIRMLTLETMRMLKS